MSLDLKRFDSQDLFNIHQYFDNHGFVIVKNALSLSLLQDFTKEYAQIVEINLNKSGTTSALSTNDRYFISEGIKALELSNHSWVSDIYDTSAMLPSFLNIISNPLTLQIIKNLLDISTPLYPYTNRIRIDPPSDNRRTYGWHQETFYTIPRSSFVQTWAPLIYDVRAENGTISVADGSHKEGIPEQSWTEIPGGATQILIRDEIISKYPKIEIEMNVGELLFFSGRLAHKSGNNISKNVRFSLVGMYHDVSKVDFIAPSIAFNHKHEDPKKYFEAEMKKFVV
jgi:ectoine hydroxylase-related dioxygenase (phytanoyl-CoA dioxygenase family)